MITVYLMVYSNRLFISFLRYPTQTYLPSRSDTANHLPNDEKAVAQDPSSTMRIHCNSGLQRVISSPIRCIGVPPTLARLHLPVI